MKKNEKQSFQDEKDFSKERIHALNVQKTKIKDRLEKIYIDKLDGNITNEFWFDKHTQWNNELETIQIVLNSYEKTSVKYLEEGVKILELCTKAYRLYSHKLPDEKVKMLKILLSNSTLKGGKIGYEYNKPFDILAKGLAFDKKYA
jgi:hypothetical protein